MIDDKARDAAVAVAKEMVADRANHWEIADAVIEAYEAAKTVAPMSTSGEMVDEIEREIMTWRGANGGVYTIRACAVAVAQKMASRLEALEAPAPVDLMERVEKALAGAKAFHDRDQGCNGFTADYECLRLEIDEALTDLRKARGKG